MSLKKYLKEEIDLLQNSLDKYCLSYFDNKKTLNEIICEKDIYEKMFPNWKKTLNNNNNKTKKEKFYFEDIDLFLKNESNNFEEIPQEVFDLVEELTKDVEPFIDNIVTDTNLLNINNKIKDNPFDFIETLEERKDVLEKTLKFQKDNINSRLNEIISLKTKLSWFKKENDNDNEED